MKSALRCLASSRLKVPQLGRGSRRLCRFAITGRLVRHDGNPSGTAPARDRWRQLSRCGFADKDCALVALVRHLRQGLRKSDRGLYRRAHVHRSGSVYRGNAAWKLSGNDGPDRNVADARLLQNRACAAWLEQTRMAGGLRALYWKGVRNTIPQEAWSARTRRKKVTDVVVIGAGPAGVIAALRAAELGAHTELIARAEFGPRLGAYAGRLGAVTIGPGVESDERRKSGH